MERRKSKKPLLKKKKKVSRPEYDVVPLRTRPMLLASSNADEQFVEAHYKKVSKCGFFLWLKDVDSRSTAEKKCIDLLWQIPGFVINYTDQANAIHIKQTVYKMTNECDYDLYFRMQRPLGFTADPSSVALWEPVMPQHAQDLIFCLKPRQTVEMHVSNRATLLMTPRHRFVDNKDYIHLSTISLFRESLNIHGNDKADTGVAVNIIVETYFNMRGGSNGKVGDYRLETYKTTKHMDIVSAGPVTSMRFLDIQPTGRSYKYITFQHLTDTEYGLNAYALAGVNNDGTVSIVDDWNIYAVNDATKEKTFYFLPRTFAVYENNDGEYTVRNINAIGYVYIKWKHGRQELSKFMWLGVSVCHQYDKEKNASQIGIDWQFLKGNKVIEPKSVRPAVYSMQDIVRPFNYDGNKIKVIGHDKGSVNALRSKKENKGLMLGEDAYEVPFLTIIQATITVIDVLRSFLTAVAGSGVFKSEPITMEDGESESGTLERDFENINLESDITRTG